MKSFDAIMALQGVDDFKGEMKRLHTFFANENRRAIRRIPLPSYLFAIQRGGGMTTLLRAFADYLYEAEAADFSGAVKAFEFKVGYLPPEAPFPELARLQRCITAYAGHNRFYKGVICLNIDEWLGHANEDHFTQLLNYIDRIKEHLILCFCVHETHRERIKPVEAALLSRLRVEVLLPRFPDTIELVRMVEYRARNFDYSFSESGRALVHESLDMLSHSRDFHGFRTVEKLIDEILFLIMTSEDKAILAGERKITAETLAELKEKLRYIEQVKAQNAKNAIGFSIRSHDYE